MIDPIAQLQEDSIGDSVEVKPPAASHGRRPCIAEADADGRCGSFQEAFQMCIRLFWKADVSHSMFTYYYIFIVYVRMHQ